MVARGFQSASHPVLAQIVPIRRCNLACTYCNEYDKHSPPVALATMRERIDHLARLARRTSRSAAASRCCTPTSTSSSGRSVEPARWRA